MPNLNDMTVDPLPF